MCEKINYKGSVEFIATWHWKWRKDIWSAPYAIAFSEEHKREKARVPNLLYTNGTKESVQMVS